MVTEPVIMGQLVNVGLQFVNRDYPCLRYGIVYDPKECSQARRKLGRFRVCYYSISKYNKCTDYIFYDERNIKVAIRAVNAAPVAAPSNAIVVTSCFRNCIKRELNKSSKLSRQVAGSRISSLGGCCSC